MSKPKETTLKDALKLILLGTLLAITATRGILPEYINQQGRKTPFYYILIGFLLLMPPAVLGYIRKNTAKKNGDWHILYLLCAFTTGLVYVLTR